MVSIKTKILSPLALCKLIRYYKTTNLFGFAVYKYKPIFLPNYYLLLYSIKKHFGISTNISTHLTFAK